MKSAFRLIAFILLAAGLVACSTYHPTSPDNPTAPDKPTSPYGVARVQLTPVS